jgi:hypothetical protein
VGARDSDLEPLASASKNISWVWGIGVCLPLGRAFVEGLFSIIAGKIHFLGFFSRFFTSNIIEAKLGLGFG